MKRMALLAAMAGMALAGAVRAQADDDLAVVRKAVATNRAVPSAEAAVVQAEAPLTPPATRKGGKPEPQWLRVRVFEKDAQGDTRKRVSINLPLSLVRAVDDLPIDLCRHHGARREGQQDQPGCELRVADVLAALEAGQELVEIESEESTVKVWVE